MDSSVKVSSFFKFYLEQKTHSCQKSDKNDC